HRQHGYVHRASDHRHPGREGLRPGRRRRRVRQRPGRRIRRDGQQSPGAPQGDRDRRDPARRRSSGEARRMSGDGHGAGTDVGPEPDEGAASRTERRIPMDPVTPADERDRLALAGRRPGPGLAIEPGIILREAWTIFASAWPTCLVLYWGAGAACWLIINLLVIFLASTNLAIGDPAITPFLAVLRFLGLFLVPAGLWLGQVIAFLKIARKQPVAQQDLFRGGPYLLTALLTIGTFVTITAVPCLLVYGGSEALLALGGGDPLVATVRRLLP